jgi:HAD superfamily phosphoserine phosphatase-like hydrolase
MTILIVISYSSYILTIMKTIVFDVDHTLTTTGSWERLNTAAGVTTEEDYDLYRRYMCGDFDYSSWTTQLSALYHERKQLTKDLATKALLHFELRAGVIETIQALQDIGHPIVLISGGFREMVEAIGTVTGVSTTYATSDLVFDNGGYFDKFISRGEEGEAKAQLLRQHCINTHIAVTDCVAVGDSTNDITLFTITGNGVTFSWCKPAVQAAAHHIINDIRDLPILLI